MLKNLLKKICDYKIIPPPTSKFNPTYLTLRTLIPDIEKTIPNIDNGTVLDIGCGEKPYRHHFKTCDHYFGIDIHSSKQADVVASATKLAIRNNAVDNVCAFQVFEHINDTDFLFREIHRVLKPGGELLVSLPQSYRIHEEPHDYYRFTKYGITYLCDKYGFDILLLKANGGSWAMAGLSMLNIISWSRRLSKALLPVYFLFNLIFGTLDTTWPDEQDTLNYIFLAKKRQIAAN